MAQIKAGRYA